MNKVYYTIAILSIICLSLSVIIQIDKTAYTSNTESFCLAVTGSNGCRTVQTSSYSQTFGISNPVYGIVGFSLLAILSLLLAMYDNDFIRYLVMAGGIIAGSLSMWFLYVQTFVLHTYCVFCVIVDLSSLTLFCLSIYILAKYQKQSQAHPAHK